jgi:hypothetical protein
MRRKRERQREEKEEKREEQDYGGGVDEDKVQKKVEDVPCYCSGGSSTLKDCGG